MVLGIISVLIVIWAFMIGIGIRENNRGGVFQGPVGFMVNMVILISGVVMAINSFLGLKMNMRAIPILVFLLMACGYFTAKAEPSQQQLNATFQSFVEGIKKECGIKYPVDDEKYKICGETKHIAMTSFFEKLFYYRDNEGTYSKGFRVGTDCLTKHSPKVIDPNRKVAIERADWRAANDCYQDAIK